MNILCWDLHYIRRRKLFRVNNSNKKRVRKFQGIRGIASISIIISHFFPHYDLLGAFGVSVFICLSGFLCVYNYVENTRYDLRWFLRKFAKVYPLYLIITIITAQYFNASIVYGVDDKTNCMALWANIFMIQTYTNNIVFWGPFSQVGWYIPFFALAVLVTPLFMKIWKIINTKQTIIILIFIIIFEFGVCKLGMDNFLVDYWLIYLFPPFRLIEFFAGGCVGCLFRDGKKISSKNHPLINQLVLIADVCFIIYLLKIVMEKGELLFVYSAIWLMPVWILILTVSYCQGKVEKALFENIFVVFIGNMSLELFLCHLCIKHFFEKYMLISLGYSWYYLFLFTSVFLISFLVKLLNDSVYLEIINYIYKEK